MEQITITVGEELFQFASFGQWVAKAQSLFRQYNRTDGSTLAIDQMGRICNTGREFMRARDDGSFPVRVFVKVV